LPALVAQSGRIQSFAILIGLIALTIAVATGHTAAPVMLRCCEGAVGSVAGERHITVARKVDRIRSRRCSAGLAVRPLRWSVNRGE
jgi:hypothetical protein